MNVPFQMYNMEYILYVVGYLDLILVNNFTGNEGSN